MLGPQEKRKRLAAGHRVCAKGFRATIQRQHRSADTTETDVTNVFRDERQRKLSPNGTLHPAFFLLLQLTGKTNSNGELEMSSIYEEPVSGGAKETPFLFQAVLTACGVNRETAPDCSESSLGGSEEHWLQPDKEELILHYRGRKKPTGEEQSGVLRFNYEA